MWMYTCTFIGSKVSTIHPHNKVKYVSNSVTLHLIVISISINGDCNTESSEGMYDYLYVYILCI
jgi:hypothetical protein